MRPLPLAPVFTLCATIPGAEWTVDGHAVVATVNDTTIRVTGSRVSAKGKITGSWVAQSPLSMERRIRRLIAEASGEPAPTDRERQFTAEDLACLVKDAPAYDWAISAHGTPCALVGDLRIIATKRAVSVYDAATQRRLSRVEVFGKSLRPAIERALALAKETT